MSKLCPIAPDIGHFMCDDQMMFSVDRDLDIVSDNT